MSEFRPVLPEDESVIHDICYCCGSYSMKQTYAYIRRAIHLSSTSGTQVVYETDGTAFYLAIVARTHLRLIALAVSKGSQGNGIGTAAVARLKAIALGMGRHRITFRTSMSERAKDFWLRQRAKIVGIKGEDYEMELLF